MDTAEGDGGRAGEAAILYGAKSTKDLRDSIPGQLSDGRRLAVGHGWTVVAEYSDNAKSAYRGNRGEQLAKAKAHAEQLAAEHGACHLVVQHTDRLARGDGVHADHLVELALWALRAGVSIQSVQDPGVAEGGLAFAAMMGDRNHADSKRKALAVADGLRRTAERGGWVGGHCADGYLIHRSVDDHGKTCATVAKDPDRTPLWVFVWQAARDDWSTEAITTEVDRRGWMTNPKRKDHRPRPFDANRINQSLDNPFYAGLAVHRGEVVARGHWEPYVSPEDFYRLRNTRRARAHVDKRKAGRPVELFLLAGIARCGVCGEPMRTERGRELRKDGTRSRTYVCNRRKSYRPGHQLRCDAPTVDADVVDPAVLAQLPALLGDGDGMLRELLAGRAAERERLTQQAQSARQELAECERVAAEVAERIVAAVAAGDLETEELLKQGNRALRKRQQSAQQRLDATLDALTLATDETPEAQRAAFYERLDGQLTGRLDGARDDVKHTNLVLREFFSKIVLSETATGVQLAPQLSDAAAARILRDVQRWPHGADVQIGGYPAEIVAATGAVKGSEMELVLRVPRRELADAMEAIQREGGTVVLTTPAIHASQSALTSTKTSVVRSNTTRSSSP